MTVLSSILLVAWPEAETVIVVVPFWWLGWTVRDAMGTGWVSSMLRGAAAFILVQLTVSSLLRLVLPQGPG